jgi:hypothetical protein
MINALPVSVAIIRRDRVSVQSDEIECLLELGESEFPGRVELESEEETSKGYPSCWEIDI